jgi:glycosyltransferase involved in cell wall biosynthesis
MLVPHEPSDDPRVGWVTDLCRQVGPTEVLAAVWRHRFPAREFDGDLYVERGLVERLCSPRSLRALDRSRGLYNRRVTRRYTGLRLRTVERQTCPEPAREGAAAPPGDEGPRRAPLRRAARCLRLQYGRLLRFAAGYLALRPLVSAMDRRARAVSIIPRVVVCHGPCALGAAVGLKRQYGCPVIYDSPEYWPEADPLSYGWEVRARAALERRLIRRADVVVTATPQLARHLREVYRLRCVLSVPSAGPLRPPALPSDRPVTQPVRFLLQGQAAPGRGIEALLSAWGLLADGRAVLYCRCPEDEYLRDLRQRFAGLAERGRVVFLPADPAGDPVQAAAFADVGVLPYPLTTLNHVYGCPNELPAYVQAGLAVLGTRSAFVSSVLHDSGAGVTYDAAFPASLLAAVRGLVESPARLGDMKRRALAYARAQFHWERLAAPYREAVARFYHAGAAAAAPAW